MEIDDGFAPIFRKIIKSDVWVNPELLKVWIWCLIRMNQKDNKVNLKVGKGYIVVPVKAGQFIYGRHKAAEELLMPASSVRNRMDKLEEMGKLDRKKDNQYSIVTICNWVKYKEWLGNNRTAKRTTKGQPKDTNKDNKELYKDYVYLDKEEYSKLSIKLSNRLDEYIERLNGYIGQIGVKEANRRYSSHYHTILNWHRKDPKPLKEVKDNGDCAELDKLGTEVN